MIRLDRKSTLTPNAEKRFNEDLCTKCMKCVDACLYDALVISGTEMTVGELIDEVARDIPFYRNSGGGMSLSGGEPLVQADFAEALLKAAKEKGMNTCVDTSGFVSRKNIEQVLPYVDLFLYDVKHMDSDRHKEVTGQPNKIILDNLKYIAENGGNIHIRIPLIPEFNDNEKYINDLCAFIKPLGIKDIDVLPYHDYCEPKYNWLDRKGLFYKMDAIPDEKVEHLVKMLKDNGFTVTIGG